MCIVGRNEDKCRTLVESLPAKAEYALRDLTVPEECAAAVTDAVKLLGGLDVLVNVGE